MKEADLRNGLGAHLDVMPDRPPIAFENVDLDQNDQTYLSQSILPAEDTPVGIEQGGTDMLTGIYQIMVNVKKDLGWGAYVAELERIKAHFPRSGSIIVGGTRITFVKIFASSAIIDSNFFRVPISIRYSAI